MSQRADNYDANSTASKVLKSPKEFIETLATQLENATDDDEKQHIRLLLNAAMTSIREEDALKPFSGGGTAENKYEMMTLYNHNPHPSPDHARWSEFQDPLAEEKRLEGLGKTYAIIHRQKKVEKDDLVSWVTASLEAHSPRLRKILDSLFDNYPSWYPDGSLYAVAPPFQPYVHRWEAFLQVCEQRELDDRTTRELQLLRRELEPRISGALSALDRVKKTGVVSFKDLWLILNPGCYMISRKEGSTRVFKCVQVAFIPETALRFAGYKLTLAHVEWSGTCSGISVTTEEIKDYEDSISVAKLPVYPVDFEEQWEETKRRLITRGRKFESLRGFHVKVCHGKKYTLDTEKSVSGRVIVDAYAYYKVQDKVPPTFITLSDSRMSSGALSPPAPTHLPVMEADHDNILSLWSIFLDSCKSESDSRSNPRRNLQTPGRNNIEPDDFENETERKEDKLLLTDDECIISSPRVKGFDLSAKEWCEFDIDDIEDVAWNDSPYENLVLPDGEKDLVFAFANRPRFGKPVFDDFVTHKGKGIIILLAGPPGVGKTLTAESVAERSKVPLYVISASDLGTTAESVDKGLVNAFKICQLWDAVLLLDEADVFLDSRDSQNLQRNEVVSIFLRRLEYYKGLMFLTTNRITAIDSAFKSRIDLILPYLGLDQASRRRIWANFIGKLAPGVASISDDDLDKLAETPLNGREIKNSIKTALVLADRDRPLRLKHVEVVLNIHKRVTVLGLTE
ncbi:hypothetical protein NPX13_g3330 [Xylaria arbuscula]|uniref:AAA+ ATPase domain-containing protein n=1 Tax=Xylaria arbuscula TaxID=114810 RepID=A0A9W8NIF5_9PEZI|nr:hypothetical protein NPX13_g3330 [Xylaria arbuscula]